jgi:transcriptional regulator GlxA family with amidase domain
VSSASRDVVFVAYDGVQLLDIAGPIDVFDAAGRVLEASARGTAYGLTVATPGGAGVRTSSGVGIAADADLADIDAATVDTVLVPGALAIEGSGKGARVIEALPRLAAGARRTCSVCGGAFLLAEAGLLDGRRATTHWAGCAGLRDAYPAVTVEPDRIFVRDGDVFTSAGVSAGIDLALALVEEDHGAEVARTIARWLVVFLQRPGGQSQFSERVELPLAAESPLRALVDEVVADPAGDHRVPELAGRASLSERQLTRLFVKQAQTTPARFVERVRVEAARGLLEASQASVDSVASSCGFGSAETMRRAFLRILGIGPGEYRRRFSAIDNNYALEAG